MIITLQSLSIQNFKGIKALDLSLGGRSAVIRGRNATGKSSVYDAFLWLLFDKDSTGRKDFAVKPQDADGNEIHNLETIVAADLLINGAPHQLRKVWAEKWTKKRGHAEQEFAGHTTAYYVDGVPKSATEYKAWVAALVDDGIFRLIANPVYFNTALKWQERREILFSMVRTMTDEEIIAASPEFAGLDLGGHTVDDARKVARDTLKKLNQDLDKVPVRIDELVKSLPVEDETDTDARAAAIRKQIEAVDAKLADAAERSKGYVEAQRGLAMLRDALDARKRALDEEATAAMRDAYAQAARAEAAVLAAETRLTELVRKRESMTKEAAEIEEAVIKLRAEWDAISKEIPEPVDPAALSCPTCGREFDPEERERIIGEATEAFKRRKHARLEAVTKEGKEKSARLKELQKELDAAERDITLACADLDAAKEDAEAAKAVPVDIAPDYDADAEYARLKASVEQTEKSLAAPPDTGTDALLAEKARLTESLDIIKTDIAKREAAHATRVRIAELEREQKRLAQAVADQEKLLYQLERFASHKCRMLEESVNALFPTVRWKLFDVQINGGIADTCECMVGGVPFPDANNAARINAGIEIASVLAEHYLVSLPCWVDNAEAVNELRGTGGQMIALVVSDDPGLVVETEAEKKEEVA